MKHKSLPPLNWLRTFQVAARCLNFTHAAQELHLTQGAVSQQIRLLESHLGVTLFKRLPRGLSLSDDGLCYFPVVQDAISRLAVGTNEIFNKNDTGLIKIRGSLSFFSHWLAPKLADFKRLYPHIELRYTSNIWLQELDGEEDLEIRWGHGDWPGLVSQRLTWDALVPVCSAQLMARSALLTPSDLADHDLLHVLGYEEGWGYWLDMMGVQGVDASAGMQFDTLVSTLRMAELGLGVALARSSMVADMLQQGSLLAPFGQTVDASESFYLVYRSGANLHPDAGAFSNWLVAQAHRHK